MPESHHRRRPIRGLRRSISPERKAKRSQKRAADAEHSTKRAAAKERGAVTRALLELFAHTPSGPEYFEAVARVLHEWVGCQCLGIRVLDEQGSIPYCASIGFDPEFLKLEGSLSLKTDRCFCIRAISSGKEDSDRNLLTRRGSLHCGDAPAFMRQLAPEVRPQYRGTCAKWGFASIAVIPVMYRDQVLGAIHLADRRSGLFEIETVEFVESITPLIGEAIQRFHAEAKLSRYRDHLEDLVRQRTAELEAMNKQLKLAEADLQRERDQLELRVRERTADLSNLNLALQAEMAQRRRAEREHKKLLRRLDEAQESERGRISRELHDRLGQELTAMKLGLRLLKNQESQSGTRQSVVQLETLADGLMRSIHRLAWELRPAALDDLGLEAALRRFATEWSGTSGIAADFHCSGLETARLQLELETALYRVTQEALTNIVRHACAHRVGILLERRAGRISLVIEDDGCGFDAAGVFQNSEKLGRLGLLGMQERIRLVGGEVEIESAIGSGTTVFVRVPLEDT